MTVAWYGHLKFTNKPLWLVIIASWAIALAEYCFAVPANRIGFLHGYTLGQLKVIQEVVSVVVFAVFAVTVMGEKLKWNHAAAFVCLVAAGRGSSSSTSAESGGGDAPLGPGGKALTKKGSALTSGAWHCNTRNPDRPEPDPEEGLRPRGAGRRRHAPADGRHAGDHVRGAGHRRLRSRSASPSGIIVMDLARESEDPAASVFRQSKDRLALGGDRNPGRGLPVGARNLRRGGTVRARAPALPELRRRSGRGRRRGPVRRLHPATKWTTPRACCSSTTSRASNANAPSPR